MRLVTLLRGGTPAVAVVDDGDHVHLLRDILGGEWPDVVDVIERWDDVSARLSTWQGGGGLPLAEANLLAPIPRPRRNIFCVGKNYREHAQEFGSSGYDQSSSGDDHVPKFPIIFSKPPSSVIGPDASIDPHPT